MTNGRTQLTIELRTKDGDDARAYATVSADRATFDGGRLIAWLDGDAIASYPVGSVAALRFGDAAAVSNAAATATAAAAAPAAPAAAPTVTAPPVPTSLPVPAQIAAADTSEAAATPPSGVGWTPGEDSLLRTLSDQHAGLTMMILKTKRPMDEVVARLSELGIDPVSR
ncbi:MAG TPA: hypothetical protein VH442_20670 [Micromonosporaceae bacterium]